MPKGIVQAKIYTNDLDFGKTPAARVFVIIWKNVLLEYLREFQYEAGCASLCFSTMIYHESIDFSWDGFNDSMPVFIQETFKRLIAMRSADLKSIFDQVKEAQLQEMKNFYLN